MGANGTSVTMPVTDKPRKRRNKLRVVSFADTQKPMAESEVFMKASVQRHKDTVEAVRRHREELVT
ncbi:hypothetical protein GCM10007159_40780 [Modicisalibacter luteus]|nr:hypothetical protein GCM10007159_40780 [Halomonas lutea]